MASSIPPCNGDLRNMSGWYQDMSALLHVLDSEPGMVALQEEAGQAAVGVKAMDKIFRDFRHDLERFDALQFDVSLVLDLECLYQKANLFQIEFVQIFSHVEEIKQEFESFTQNLRQWATKHEKTREEYLTRLKPQLAELQRLMDNDTSAGDGGSYSFDFAGAFQAAAVSLFAASVFALQGSNLVLPSLVRRYSSTHKA
ncbi:hypothetical protein L211DRAFT_853314 [Terfezia boudieri ATCC MYA-4762]|uniref:Uncharacterized protein n=1 Tax=Terfezia boudieri ATCC MYA-4762 TaxID=1051890 RepID=A0A3N4L9P4_9PEZI|nr:hypothetical protein L211DRAFT_853314 [Terfezia boudieri ATCC MYA-4762]